MAEVGPCGGRPARDRGRRETRGAHLGHPALEVLDRGIGHRPSAERAERGQVAAVGVDGARRALRGEEEEEALDVMVGFGHGETGFNGRAPASFRVAYERGCERS